MSDDQRDSQVGGSARGARAERTDAVTNENSTITEAPGGLAGSLEPSAAPSGTDATGGASDTTTDDVGGHIQGG